MESIKPNPFINGNISEILREVLVDISNNRQGSASFLVVSNNCYKRLKLMRLKNILYPIHYPKHIKPRNKR